MTTREEPRTEQSALSALLLTFLPILVFGVAVQRVPFLVAAVVAVVVAVVVLLAGRAASRLVLVTSAVLLAAFVVAGAAGGAVVQAALVQFGRGLLATAIAVVLLLTVPTRPFTVAFAKRSAPAAVWTSPAFIAVNRRISAVWGSALLLAGVLELALAAALGGTRLAGAAGIVAQWGPTLLAVAVAVPITQAMTGAARRKGGDAA